MSHLQPLDPAFPIERQLGVDATPVVLVNVFTLDKADEQAFLEAWQVDAVFMKRQPGFISTQLHRAIGEGPTYLNYAVWEFDRSLQGRIHAAGIQGGDLALSGFGRRSPAPVPESRRAGHLRRIAGGLARLAEARCAPRPRAA